MNILYVYSVNATATTVVNTTVTITAIATTTIIAKASTASSALHLDTSALFCLLLLYLRSLL